nr:MAG TPA: hypothetical protein [Caudoviricetes sp.]
MQKFNKIRHILCKKCYKIKVFYTIYREQFLTGRCVNG